MTRREEVIKELKQVATDDYVMENNEYHAILCGEAAELLEHSEPVLHAEWRYYVNDENRPRWRCSNCRKLCRRNPHDKKRCSNCGAHMKMEGDR